MLILHLKWLDRSTLEMKNEIEFPLINHSLLNHVTSRTNSDASCNLRGVTNHKGTGDAGDYTGLCRS